MRAVVVYDIVIYVSDHDCEFVMGVVNEGVGLAFKGFLTSFVQGRQILVFLWGVWCTAFR